MNLLIEFKPNYIKTDIEVSGLMIVSETYWKEIEGMFWHKMHALGAFTEIWGTIGDKDFKATIIEKEQEKHLEKLFNKKLTNITYVNICGFCPIQYIREKTEEDNFFYE